MVAVLFVCLGNICRSPMAEGVFTHLVAEADLGSKFKIDSAGTSNYHIGDQAHLGTRKILNAHNIAYTGRSRQITTSDFKTFDYIVAMDAENLADLHQLQPPSASKIYRLLDFATQSTVRDVPDPYYNRNFDYVYELVRDGCAGLLAHIQEVEQV